ncbi:MAG: hypothetical protein LUF78_06510 [Clostridiales bacterium]|nr:hypothetical protein [Clostridiales bacterium]
MERLQKIRNSRPVSRGIGYYNAVYGLGMLLVILGHSTPKIIFYEEMTRLESAWAVFGNSFMVVFFVLSGFGIHTMSVKKNLVLNFKRILVPYYITAFCVLLSKYGLSILENRSFWEHGGEYLLTYLLALNVEGGGTLWGIPVESISTLWFLWALFEARVLYNLICQSRREKYIWILSFLCSLLGFAMTCISKVWPFILDIGFMAVGWIALGDFIARKNLLDRKYSFKMWGLLFVFSLYSLLFSYVKIMEGIMTSGILDLAGITCLAVVLIKVFDDLLARFSDSKIILALGCIGSLNIYIFCVHSYEQKILPLYRVESLFNGNVSLQVLLKLFIRGMFIGMVCLILIYGKQIFRKFKRRNKKKIHIELE